MMGALPKMIGEVNTQAKEEGDSFRLRETERYGE